VRKYVSFPPLATMTFSENFTTVTILLQKPTAFGSPIGQPPDDTEVLSCDRPRIEIHYQLNSVTFDVIEVVYYVRDCMLHCDGLGEYCGSITPIQSTNNSRRVDGTRIQVLLLSITSVIKGKGTLLERVNELGISLEMYEFILYILVSSLQDQTSPHLCGSLRYCSVGYSSKRLTSSGL